MITHLRRALLASTVTVVATAIVWSGLWLLAASQYKRVIDGWVAAGRSSGYDITFDKERLFGYPRHVVLRFSSVAWKNDMNIIFHADDIDIAATPWEWQVFDAKFKNHVQITAPIDTEGHALVLGGRDGRAHVELDDEGFWRRARVSLADAEFGQTPAQLVHAERLEASAERPLLPPKDHTEPGLMLTASAQQTTLPQLMPSPFGYAMESAAVDLRVMGDTPDFRRVGSVEAWNRDSGVVEFRKLDLKWGALDLKAKGTMGFDDDLQPEGAFAASLAHMPDVIKVLMAGGFIAKSQQEMFDQALTLFAKPSKFHADGDIELPVSVQLGGLFLGPVRIFQYPPIEWPQGLPNGATLAPTSP